jgi:hypothetical protein
MGERVATSCPPSRNSSRAKLLPLKNINFGGFGDKKPSKMEEKP